MKIIATPLCMTPEYFRRTVTHGLNFPVGELSDYDPRLTETHDVQDAATVLDRVWERFQNLDDSHLCPDGGRSMMVGDLIHLVYEDGSNDTFMVEAIGFKALDINWAHIR